MNKNLNIEITDYWKRFINGDDKAYSCLYQLLVQDLFQYGLCFSTDTDLIQDCIQDLFVYLYMHRNKLDESCNVKSYLLISLKHNLHRNITRESNHEPITESMSFLPEISVEENYIENESNQNDRYIVEKILSSLSPRQREILYYRFIQELPMEEICKLMEINYQSAQNLIQRSLKKIRETYGDHFIMFILCWINMHKDFSYYS